MMKIIVLILMLVVSFSFRGENQDRLSKTFEISDVNDKEFLLNYFEKTTKELQSSIAGLNEAQMKFRPSESNWSISQVLEHIILTEGMLFGMLKEGMKNPANPERKEEIRISDDEIIQAMTDRSKKAQASADIIGEGKYKNPREGLKDLKVQRKKILEYLKGIQVEELRDRVSDSPFGPVDSYQSFLFMAGHTARHRLQIEEIKASENFPS